MNKILRKIIIIFTILLFIVVTSFFTCWKFFNINIIDESKELILFLKGNEYKIDNYSDFSPCNIESKIVESDFNGSSIEIPMFCYNKLIKYEVPSDNVFISFSDTSYDINGSFYCSLSLSNELNKEFKVLQYYTGKNRPVILEVYIKDIRGVLYIQCYTGESLKFFKEYDWTKVEPSQLPIDLYCNVEKESKLVKITEKYDSTADILNKDVYYILDNYNKNYQDYFKTEKYNKSTFMYKRCIGTLENDMLIEYERFKSLGYSFEDIGFNGTVYYLSFDNIKIVAKYLTRNSYLIYYII